MNRIQPPHKHLPRIQSFEVRQGGITLIEVLIAMLVFIIASTALITSVGYLFGNNSSTKAMIDTDSAATSFDAVIKGNPSLLSSSLNGLSMTKGAAKGTTAIDQWWTSAQAVNPFLEKADVTTKPTACAPQQPCLVSLSITVKLPTRQEVTRTYALQENF